MKLRSILPLVLLGLLLSSCTAKPSLQSIQGSAMGTTYEIKWSGSALEEQTLGVLVAETLETVEDLASNWREDSQISALERSAGSGWVKADEALLLMLDQAVLLHTKTDGLYDITLGEVIDLWGFGPEKTDWAPPGAQVLKAAMQRVGMHKIKRKGNQVQLPAQMRINLSSLAKGYAVDLMAALMLERGVHNFIVELGGELRVSGRRPGGRDWVLGVQHPEKPGLPLARLVLAEGGAVATSGDYNNFFVHEGVKYGHLIDARTGQPVRHAASITVIDASCMRADGWATALAVLPPREAWELAQQQGLAAIFYWSAEGRSFSGVSEAARSYVQDFSALSLKPEFPEAGRNGD